MKDEQYLHYCQTLFADFAHSLLKRSESLTESDSLRELALSFSAAAELPEHLHETAPALIVRLFTTYPDFAPTLPRDLLWFLGGDCLHFMPDTEIAVYQQLDELRAEAAARGEVLDFREARAKLLKLQ